MSTTWLLASFLILSPPPEACAGAPAVVWAAQPPQPGDPTPDPSDPTPTSEPGEPTPEPGEPVEPPNFEDPTPAPDDHGMPTPDPAAPCCFTHPRYSGTCTVTPTEDETCASILAYLNDQKSVGKTYCNHTDVRGGWKPVQCVAE